MKCIASETINFLSNTFPKIYSSLYLEYLKQYSSTKNVNKTQLRALLFISNYGDISMTELCTKLNIEKGSLTSMVDDLTNKEYVIRNRDLKDRRKFFISITNKGNKLALDFIESFSTKLEEKLSKLTHEEQKRYLEAITTLHEILNKEEIN